MKKLLYILPLFFLIGFPVLAKAETGVKNQNQIQTQNQGEGQQIQQQTQEMEEQETKDEDTEDDGQRGEGLQNRNPKALENMSVVSRKVQELLQTKSTGGIGEQVREIAREQNQAQIQIQDGLEKIGNRKGFVKNLFGPDYKAIKNLNKQMEQNQLRIEMLQQLVNQVENQADETQIQEAILALTEQNTALQEQIQSEEKIGSLFGWLLKLFAK